MPLSPQSDRSSLCVVQVLNSTAIEHRRNRNPRLHDPVSARGVDFRPSAAAPAFSLS